MKDDYLEVHPVVLSRIALLLGPDPRPHLLRRHVEVQTGQVRRPKAGKHSTLLIGLLVNGRRCNLGCTPDLDPGTMGIVPP